MGDDLLCESWRGAVLQPLLVHRAVVQSWSAQVVSANLLCDCEQHCAGQGLLEQQAMPLPSLTLLPLPAHRARRHQPHPRAEGHRHQGLQCAAAQGATEVQGSSASSRPLQVSLIRQLPPAQRRREASIEHAVAARLTSCPTLCAFWPSLASFSNLPLPPNSALKLCSLVLLLVLIVLQVNQIGSLTESIQAVKMSKAAGWGVMTSHR